MKNFNNFDDYMEKNPEEWAKFSDLMKEESNWKDIENEIESSLKGN